MRNQVSLAGLFANFLLTVVIGPLTTSFLMFLSSFSRESVTHLPARLLVKFLLVEKLGSIHHFDVAKMRTQTQRIRHCPHCNKLGRMLSQPTNIPSERQWNPIPNG